MRYPYIPREYYPAVMFAAKMVREGTGRNVAVRRAADYYDVDEGTVSAHLAARSAAGRKAKSKLFTYKWFVVEDQFGTDARGVTSIKYVVARGKSAETVNRRFADKDMRFNRYHDYGGGYAPNHWHAVLAEFATKAEAEECAARYTHKED